MVGAKGQGGFTLVEAMLAAAVLATAVTAILLPFSTAVVNEHNGARLAQANMLAQEVMEEILSKPFFDPNGAGDLGPEAGENARSEFDNVDDYDGYSEATGEIRLADGTLVTDASASGLSRSVSVAYVYVNGQETTQGPSFARVTVDVEYNGQPVVSLTRLIYSMK